MLLKVSFYCGSWREKCMFSAKLQAGAMKSTRAAYGIGSQTTFIFCCQLFFLLILSRFGLEKEMQTAKYAHHQCRRLKTTRVLRLLGRPLLTVCRRLFFSSCCVKCNLLFRSVCAMVSATPYSCSKTSVCPNGVKARSLSSTSVLLTRLPHAPPFSVPLSLSLSFFLSFPFSIPL